MVHRATVGGIALPELEEIKRRSAMRRLTAVLLTALTALLLSGAIRNLTPAASTDLRVHC
jgi:hypothetical protein